MLGRVPRAAAAWVGLYSLFFYGYWMPAYVVLLLASIGVNYGIGIAIGRLRDRPSDGGMSQSRWALIAGPVLHHAQMMPQFSDPAIYRADSVNVAAGLFALGLVKKIIVADKIAPHADTIFDAAAAGQSVSSIARREPGSRTR